MNGGDISMRKTLVSLAVLSIFCNPAKAQSSVTIYGILDVNVAAISTGAATNSHVTQMTSSSATTSPTWVSPISPSISARGTSAATESITIRSIEPERTSTFAELHRLSHQMRDIEHEMAEVTGDALDKVTRAGFGCVRL